jgi:hypothetical protein
MGRENPAAILMGCVIVGVSTRACWRARRPDADWLTPRRTGTANTDFADFTDLHRQKKNDCSFCGIGEI